MTVQIRSVHPREAKELLEASHALMESLFPSESNHYLSLDELAVPEIRFLVAEDGNTLLGCGAVAIKPGYGEIKSMFTDPAARGKGVADAILSALTLAAEEEGLSALRLETGDSLDAAHRLYERHGFTRRGPFGDYPEDPLSIFYEKAL